MGTMYRVRLGPRREGIPMDKKDQRNRDIREAFESGERINQAMREAFFDAVRVHRLHNVPLVVWRDGGIQEVDPFGIAPPEEKDDPE